MNSSQAAFAELRKDLDKARTIEAMGVENQKIKASEAINHAMIGSMTRTMEGLAEQVEVMRELMPPCRPQYGAVGSRDVDIAAQQLAFDKALALPSTADAILRQRDARTLREAAQVCEHEADNAVRDGEYRCGCADAINAKADELAPRTLRTTEVSNG